jgi:hypothetical protein
VTKRKRSMMTKSPNKGAAGNSRCPFQLRLIYEFVRHTFISTSRSAAVPELWTLDHFARRMKTIRYIVVLGLLGICFGILGCLFYLDWYFYNHSPRQADAAHGFVFPATVHHGATVYLTAEQWRLFQSPTSSFIWYGLFMVAAVTAYLLNRRWRVFCHDPVV